MKTKIDKVDKLKDGVCKEYFKNGSLSCEGVYAKGEKTGEWKYYLLTGKLKAIGKYENGKMTGEWKW